MRSLLLAMLLVGCTKENPDFCPNHPDDPRCGGMGSDAGVDSDGDPRDAPPDAPACFGSGPFEVCPMGAATGTKTLSGAIDTSANGTMCNTAQLWNGTGQTSSCFIVAESITVQNVTVTGNRPLVLVATGEITLTGQLDAASHVAPPSEGPGALDPGTCGTFGTIPNGIPAGGGAGASFASGGGPGGAGGSAGNNATAGGTGYSPFLATPPGALRAGCRGQTGGTGQGSGGTGGFGGGAVYLVSGTRLTLGAAAIINASGAGAAQPGKTGGGGGGGSGGMVLLHAPDVTIAPGAIVVANGGGGSTGGDDNGAGTGTRGNDPDPANPTSAAPTVTGAGGSGGGGFAEGSTATSGGPGLSGEGGGGGGGGGGYIQSNQPLTNATVSPAANVVL